MGCSFAQTHLHLARAHTKGYQYPSVRRNAAQSETPEVVQLSRAAGSKRQRVDAALGERRTNQPCRLAKLRNCHAAWAKIATKITVPPITVACPGFSPKIHHTNKGPTTISSMVIIDTSGAGK